MVDFKYRQPISMSKITKSICDFLNLRPETIFHIDMKIIFFSEKDCARNIRNLTWKTNLCTKELRNTNEKRNLISQSNGKVEGFPRKLFEMT